MGNPFSSSDNSKQDAIKTIKIVNRVATSNLAWQKGIINVNKNERKFHELHKAHPQPANPSPKPQQFTPPRQLTKEVQIPALNLVDKIALKNAKEDYLIPPPQQDIKRVPAGSCPGQGQVRISLPRQVPHCLFVGTRRLGSLPLSKK